ncbi:TIGR03617 family F420-dependent LLM class oxidoreductase [Mycolicibacterium frederiksbergense]|uniref:TIGR03617 family F420-dependent LLM class oxidoreductase n=1 Tax=Mycolicibacterium frederiksbergense TaxID=117567 RepID=UPI00247373EE|nr:TIGR03617 family F420-dependent LLM class oxidoreductase [Mycolicibacterium frederiksbergense]
MRIHLQVDGAPNKARQSARQIAALGADGVFSFEGPHDVFFPLLVAAAETDLELMTNVAIAGPRSPLHLAHAAYDLQCYSSGRFRLGLGSQIRVHIEKRYGSEWGKPAARMAESVAAVKAIFDTWEGKAPLAFRGEYFTHTLMPPTFNPGPNPFGPPPVLMGALGPLMTRKAAEVADGLLVMPFNSARHFADRTVPAINDGLERAGRSLTALQIIAQAMVAVGRSEEALAKAIGSVAFLIAFYASTPNYRPVLEAEGLEHLQPRLNELSKAGDYPGMAALIDEDTVRTIGVVGTPEECAEQIQQRYGAYASDVCCYFPGYTPDPSDVADFVGAVRRLR